MLPALRLNLTNLSQLKAHYMPFLQRGGLFIPTNTQVEPGTKISLELTLSPNSPAVLITGELVWLTPQAAQSGQPEGLGMHFDEGFEDIKSQIEELLANFNDDPETASHTL